MRAGGPLTHQDGGPMFQPHRRPGRGSSDTRRHLALLQLEHLEDRWTPAVIGGTVYLDGNANGLLEPGETGLPGSTLQLKDGAGNVLATTTTSGTGQYQFTQRDPN